MKVITLTQPWATLMAFGFKRFETRAWNTDYRGPLAIHAAKGFPAWAKELCYADAVFQRALNCCGIETWGDLPTGCLLSAGILRDTWATNGALTPENLDFIEPDLAHFLKLEMPFGDYTEGRRFWYVSDMIRLREPIPAKGALGLWEEHNCPELQDIERTLRAVLSAII
jgi:hypothetical protein